jgi:uncharacterized DUF497 family protein
MKIVWDEPKRLANLAKHGLDFAELDEAFFETALLQPARAGRWMAIGLNIRNTISVVFAILGKEGLSFISMRPANKKERELYDEYKRQKEKGLHGEGP